MICIKVLTSTHISLTLSGARFEWDGKKEAVNIAKHGVDFTEAQSAFYDPHLVMAADKGHSATVAAPVLRWPERTRRYSYRAVHLSRRLHSNHRRRLLAKR
jgi:hypothetical protein